MKFRLSEIARVMGVNLLFPGEKFAGGWSVDTRTIQPGDVFFALRGPNYDGHAFVKTAFEKGAAAAIVDHGYDGPGDAPVLSTKDTLAALQQLAAWARSRWGGEVIGVTGSAGKTTTKDITAALLNVKMKTAKTEGNLNNHVGLPLTLLRLDETAKTAVIEMGMNHAGEIRALAEIAKPRTGIVTNVGFAHTENFASIDDVALAKRELIEALPKDGIAILNADDPRVAGFSQVAPGTAITYGFSVGATVCGEDFREIEAGMQFRVNATHFTSSLAGRHNASNLLAGIAAALAFGVTLEQLVPPVAAFRTAKMRGEKLVHNGVVIWNDCYNSNPEAARAMLDVLRATAANRRIAVLGEMRELGEKSEQLHRSLGQYAASGLDVLIGVMGDARFIVEAAQDAGLREAIFCDDALEAGKLLRQFAASGDAVLFKGSRGVRMERAMEEFMNSSGGRN